MLLLTEFLKGGGGSDGLITFNATAALSGGTIAGIANPTTVCQGTDPGAFTKSANPFWWCICRHNLWFEHISMGTRSDQYLCLYY
jgi:hypothetical protein